MTRLHLNIKQERDEGIIIVCKMLNLRTELNFHLPVFAPAELKFSLTRLQ